MTNGKTISGFIVVKKGFFEDDKTKLDVVCMRNIYDSLDDAYKATSALCESECAEYNKGRPLVNNRPVFSYQELGDVYDLAVLFWDGDDYRVVTGYNIIPVEQGNEEKQKTPDKENDITFSFSLNICGGGTNEFLSVKANTYDEAVEKAQDIVLRALNQLPVCCDYDVDLKETDAYNVFTAQLQAAVEKYGESHIDICYDDEHDRYVIKYHSKSNSFDVYGVDADAFLDDVDFVGLANKVGCGYCL